MERERSIYSEKHGEIELLTLKPEMTSTSTDNCRKRFRTVANDTACPYRYSNWLYLFSDTNNAHMLEIMNIYQKLYLKNKKCPNEVDFLNDFRFDESKMKIKSRTKCLSNNGTVNMVPAVLLPKTKSGEAFLINLKTVSKFFQSHLIRRALHLKTELLTSKYLAYFFNQLSEQFYFEMIMEICGYKFNKEMNRFYIEWNDFKVCVENEHSLDTMFLSYTNLQKQKASGLTLTFEGEQNEEEFLEERPSLRRFGDLCSVILKRPTQGYHLVCRVHGDKLMIPVLRIAFMDCVAVHGLSLSVEKPCFSNLEARIKSFRHYLTSFDASTEDLYIKYAEAGFLMTTNSNLAMCFKCGGLVVIEIKVDPWYKHACWHPRCRFLREQKGKEYIDEVRSELRRQIERTDSYELEFRIDKIINSDGNRSESENESESESDNDSAWSSDPESDYYSDSDGI